MLADAWEELKDETTVHGISKLKLENSRRTRLVWMVVLLCTLTVLTYHLSTVIRAYQRHEVNVNIELVSSHEMTFPVVTVCNNNPIRMSNLRDAYDSAADGTDRDVLYEILHLSSSISVTYRNRRQIHGHPDPLDDPMHYRRKRETKRFKLTEVKGETNILRREQQRNAGIINKTMRYIRAPERDIKSHPRIIRSGSDQYAEDYLPAFKLRERLVYLMALLPEHIKQQLGNKASDIFSCEYDGYRCDAQADFLQFSNTILGNCFTFNSNWQHNRSVRTTTRTGRRYGLHVSINANQKEYMANNVIDQASTFLLITFVHVYIYIYISISLSSHNGMSVQ